MYVKYDFHLQAFQDFNSRQKKLKLINAVRDTYKVVDTTGRTAPLDHNEGVQYKDAVINENSVFHMWKVWDDTDCATGFRPLEESRAYAVDPVSATYIWEKSKNFYKALGSTAEKICLDFNSKSKGIVIAHFTLEPEKFSTTPLVADDDLVKRYINSGIPLDDWEECTLSYSRTMSSYNQFGRRYTLNDFDRLAGLQDDTIISAITGPNSYLTLDPELPVRETRTFREQQAYGELTPAQQVKLHTYWHSGNMTAEDPHPLMALAILDDGTLFTKEAVVTRRILADDWDETLNYEGDAIHSYTLEVTINFKFKRIIDATLENVVPIVNQLTNFEASPTSWVDAQIRDMISAEAVIDLDDLCVTLPLFSWTHGSDQVNATKSYVSVQKFDELASTNDGIDYLYNVLAGTPDTEGIIGVHIEKEESSVLVQVVTMVVTVVAIIIAAVYQQWWVIPLITIGYAGVQYLIATHGKMADAQTVGEGATFFKQATEFLSYIRIASNSVAYAVSTAAKEWTADMVYDYVIDKITGFIDHIYDKIVDYFTGGLIDYASMSWMEITARILGLTNNLINVYMSVVNPPVPTTAAQTETEPVTPSVDMYETMFTLSYEYNFCELNQQMELMPYDMTQGFVDKTTSKYYNSL